MQKNIIIQFTDHWIFIPETKVHRDKEITRKAKSNVTAALMELNNIDFLEQNLICPI